MNASYAVSLGEDGQLALPVELAERLGRAAPLHLLDTPTGLVLVTREQRKQLVRRDLQGVNPVDELLADRRKLSAEEDRDSA